MWSKILGPARPVSVQRGVFCFFLFNLAADGECHPHLPAALAAAPRPGGRPAPAHPSAGESQRAGAEGEAGVALDGFI